MAVLYRLSHEASQISLAARGYTRNGVGFASQILGSCTSKQPLENAMKQFCSLLFVAIFGLLLLNPAEASPVPDRAGSLSYELMRSSQNCYDSARTSGVGGSAREEMLIVRLFGIYSGSRVLFDLIDSPDTSVRRIEDTLALVQVSVMEADDMLNRTRGYEQVKVSWRDTRAALTLLTQEFGLAARKTVERGSEKADDPEPIREPELAKPVPSMSVRISATEWAGGFTPDLVVRGVFTGKGLVSGRIEVFDEVGDSVWSNESGLTDQIARSTESFGRNEELRVDWRVRIDDDDLASGENRIVVTLKNSKGETMAFETTLRKRLF